MKLTDLVDIGHGTIIYVQAITKDRDRKILSEGIKIVQGNDWHHTGLILKRFGELVVFEQGTIHGAIFTPLKQYLEAEEAGEVLLAFKNLKDINVRSSTDIRVLNKYCDSLLGRYFYNGGVIIKMIPRQLLQRVGIETEFNSDPLKYGFVCSVMVAHLLNKYYDVFPLWKILAPDDLYLDTEYTYFVQR